MIRRALDWLLLAAGLILGAVMLVFWALSWPVRKAWPKKESEDYHDP